MFWIWRKVRRKKFSVAAVCQLLGCELVLGRRFYFSQLCSPLQEQTRSFDLASGIWRQRSRVAVSRSYGELVFFFANLLEEEEEEEKKNKTSMNPSLVLP